MLHTKVCGWLYRTMNIIKGRAKATALFMTCLALSIISNFTADMNVPILPSSVHSSNPSKSTTTPERDVRCLAHDDGARESRIMPPFKAPILITEQSVIGRPYRTCDSRSSTVTKRMERNKTIYQKASLVLTIHNSESILHVRLSMWRQNRLLRAPRKVTLGVLAVADVANRNDRRVSWFDIVAWQLFNGCNYEHSVFFLNPGLVLWRFYLMHKPKPLINIHNLTMPIIDTWSFAANSGQQSGFYSAAI